MQKQYSRKATQSEGSSEDSEYKRKKTLQSQRDQRPQVKSRFMMTRKEKKELIEERTPYEYMMTEEAVEVKTVDVDKATSQNTKKEIDRLQEILWKEQSKLQSLIERKRETDSNFRSIGSYEHLEEGSVDTRRELKSSEKKRLGEKVQALASLNRGKRS